MTDSSEITKQFGFVNNLFIGLSTGLITFLAHLSFTAEIASLPVYEKVLMIASLITAFISLLLGAILAWKRIDQFRVESRLNDLTKEEVKEHVKVIARRELIARRLLKYQGISLLLAASMLFLLALARFMIVRLV